MISISAIYIRRTNIRSRPGSYNCISVIADMNTIVDINIYIISVSINGVTTDVSVSIARPVVII